LHQVIPVTHVVKIKASWLVSSKQQLYLVPSSKSLTLMKRVSHCLTSNRSWQLVQSWRNPNHMHGFENYRHGRRSSWRTLCSRPFLTMLKDYISIQRKCKRGTVAPSQEHPTEGQRRPTKSQWNSTAIHHGSGFWDTLSKVYLNRHALQKFDRRDALGPRRAVNRDSAARIFLPDLQPFSRTGGPDL